VVGDAVGAGVAAGAGVWAGAVAAGDVPVLGVPWASKAPAGGHMNMAAAIAIRESLLI